MNKADRERVEKIRRGEGFARSDLPLVTWPNSIVRFLLSIVDKQDDVVEAGRRVIKSVYADRPCVVSMAGLKQALKDLEGNK